MKTKHWMILIAATIAAGVCAPAINAQTGTGDVRTAVGKVVTSLRQKLQNFSGQPTEAAFAGELAEFDKIIAANPKAPADELAEVLVMKSGFYAEVLTDFDKAEALVKRIKTDYPTSQAAAHVDDMLKQLKQLREIQATRAALQPGKVFPDFSVTDIAGKPLTVSQFKGKVVLIDFWATWCPPCVAEIPNVLAAYQKYHDKGFEIIGISLDRDKAALLKYIEQQKMPWPQYFEGDNPQNTLSEKYGVETIPTTYLLDAEGKIVATDLRGNDLEQQLEKLLAK
ncbi:thiol-disulfide isomerase/thioredoxin [Ereboglobus sp. PH5-10]|uniref:TlpA family protein disulfide reductase n=1 Tax=Ereboglobus sp. PH5-10 TaxID=2940629 RepID=UPI00240685C4|nr:TlpA disulfide reductase family protein [Ereboglobus sp. PH5-10]MDF9826697.1 thiol-disulfide isomerase/thioredoxin [Ereboglobus sp. PH5-10]